MTRPLKILHVASGDLWAGAEVQAFTLISHLVKIPETAVSAVLLNDGVLADKLRSSGIAVCVLNEQQIGSLGILLRLKSVIDVWRPDIVHTHRVKENILGSIASRISRNVPSVRTTHGSNERSASSGWRTVGDRVKLRIDQWCGAHLQKKIVAVSNSLGRDLTSRFASQRIVVIENGVDIDAVRSARGTAEFRSANPRAVHVGIVGRLVEVKRVDLFIQTAELLKSSRCKERWRFHIFGDGPLRSKLGELARRLAVSEETTFHGHRRDIATCIGGLDVLVNCSDHEGLPMSVLEAAALGTPCVAHAVGGLVDIVPDEFLVVKQEAAAYRDCVLRALHDDARDIIAKKALSTVTEFSACRNAERTRELYERIVEEIA